MAEGLTRHIQEVDSVPGVRGQLMRKDIAGRLHLAGPIRQREC